MFSRTPVTVVVPAYNEAATLAARLAEMMDAFAIYHSSGYDFRYLIADDGSIDETYEVGAAFASARSNVEVVRNDHHHGLGATLRTAFARITSGYVMVLDPDLSYSPATGMQLLESLERTGADIACASPYMRGGGVKNVPLIRRLLSREANRLLSFAVQGRVATVTSMVRVFRAEILPKLEFRSNGMEAVAELLLNALRRKLTIVEVPATLQWSVQRRCAAEPVFGVRFFTRCAAMLRLAFGYRPSLWLALPGVVPILLPLVVLIANLGHTSRETVASMVIVALAIQYASLVILAGQFRAFLRRTAVYTTHPTARMVTQ